MAPPVKGEAAQYGPTRLAKGPPLEAVPEAKITRFGLTSLRNRVEFTALTNGSFSSVLSRICHRIHGNFLLQVVIVVDGVTYQFDDCGRKIAGVRYQF